MRHNKKFNHLGRTAAHRKATLANMANSLIMHKRIRTTEAKAKALRVYVEPIITKAKSDTTHARRVVFQKLQNKYAVTELFGPIIAKVGERPGGYTRILKIGRRQGDDAMMVLIELVDFNEDRVKESKKSGSGKRTRRSRRKSDSSNASATIEENATVSAPTVADATESVAAN